MAKAKAKTQKKTAKAKPSAPKKSTAKAGKAKAPAGKGKAASVPAKKAGAKRPAPKKASPEKKTSENRLKEAAVKPTPKQAQLSASRTPKGEKPSAKVGAPVAKPSNMASAKPEKMTVKPALPSPLAVKPAEKVAAPPKASGKKPAPAKEEKAKAPIIAVMTGLDPLGAPARMLQRAKKERYNVEFYLNATPGSLYDRLSTPSGLSEWFCDDVNVHGDLFVFRWGTDERSALCLSRKYPELIRFQWEDDEDPGAYFELRIRIDPMTNETCLIVTDHEWPKDMEEAKALWDSQIHTLQRVLGA